MIAAVVTLSILSGTLGGGMIYLAVRWSGSNKLLLSEKDDHSEVKVAKKELDGLYENSLSVIKSLSSQIAGLKRALVIAEDDLQTFSSHAVKNVKDPETADLVRSMLARFERMRMDMSDVSETEEAASTEDRESGNSVHESDPEVTSEG